MIIDKRIICDCCGRQIVDYIENDKFCTGPKKEAKSLDFGKHCCGRCYPDYLEWEEHDREQNEWMYK